MAPHPPPTLTDDLIIDILLRLPPDDTACLTRASVCQAWRRLLSDDRAFLRRYREIHGAPPAIGFLYNNYCVAGSSPFFIPTTPASPFSPLASAGSPTCCRTLDCRHGRVLLHHPGYTSCLTVWDPVTGLQRCISAPEILQLMAAAVLCASNGCDHLDCSDDGPFLVVLLAKTNNEHPGVGVAQAQVSHWSHQRHASGMCLLHWSHQRHASGMCLPPLVSDLSVPSEELLRSKPTSWRRTLFPAGGIRTTQVECVFLHWSRFLPRSYSGPSLLAGDALCSLLEGSGRVLKYELTSGVPSVIWLPLYHGQNMTLCTVGDGELGVATVVGGSLRLVNGRTDADGISRWAQGKVIELDSLIPNAVGGASTKCCVLGFAEGTGYFFFRVNDIIFSVEVKSSRINKIGTGSGKSWAPSFHSRASTFLAAGDNEDCVINENNSSRLLWASYGLGGCGVLLQSLLSLNVTVLC